MGIEALGVSGSHAGSRSSLARELERACARVPDKVSSPAGSEILRGDGQYQPIYLLQRGWAYRYIAGRSACQIVNILLPGDLIGLRLAGTPRRHHPVRSLTDVALTVLDPTILAKAIKRRPQVGQMLLGMCMEEEYQAHLKIMVLGRRRPTARICFVILEVRDRLLQRGTPAERFFRFPITYRQMSDLIGASRSQVAASLVELRERGWATIRGGSVWIHDPAPMIDACEYAPFAHRE